MKTRIEEAAKTINLTDANASPMDMARALDADGHLLPDLPEPEFREGTAWFDGVEILPDGSAIDYNYDLPLEVAPHELRKRASALLAAANYAEERTNDQ